MRRRRRTERGSIAVEYALVLSALLMFTLGIIDCGRLLWSYATLHRATQAAARCAAVDQVICATTAQITNYAVTQAYGMQIDATAFSVATAGCGMSVTGRTTFVFAMPWLATVAPTGGPTSIALSATSCYPR